MKFALAILASSLLASSALFADDAEEVTPPPVPVVPVETAPVNPVATAIAVVSVNPMEAELLDVLLSPSPDPAAISALVLRMTPSDIAGIAVAAADKPGALLALVSQLTPGQTAAVVATLASDPKTATIVLAALNPDKLAKVRIELFLADVEAWSKVVDFLDQEPSDPKPGHRRFGTGWLDAARSRLRGRIAREGYSPEALAEAEALMQRAARPVTRGTLNQLKQK